MFALGRACRGRPRWRGLDVRRKRRAREAACADGSPRCIGCYPASISSTRPTTRLIGRPLLLDLGSRLPARRRPRAARRLAAWARRARPANRGHARAASDGNLHLYALARAARHRRGARVELAAWLTRAPRRRAVPAARSASRCSGRAAPRHEDAVRLRCRLASCSCSSC